VALTRYLGDEQLPIDNNRIEQSIRPIAVERHYWLLSVATHWPAGGGSDEPGVVGEA
jgi:hypothetical protein